jgi:hypothetical protein
MAVGALEVPEERRLLRHVHGCPRCAQLGEEYARTAKALEALIPVVSEWCPLGPRIMEAIRRWEAP